MQEMVKLSKLQPDLQETTAQSVSFTIENNMGILQTISIHACPAQFGINLKEDHVVSAATAMVDPFTSCKDLENAVELKGMEID